LHSRLVEVLPFAAALMPIHMRPTAISDLVGVADERGLTLAFLETKLYNHSAWPEFISRRGKALAQNADRAWDSEWLREVYLFMVVCGDAERANALIPGIGRATTTLDDFFNTLAKRADSVIIRLIQRYAEQDAVAAFRVASLCKIDILKTLPNIAIENVDQPLFCAILLERASSEQHVTLIFAEAGLRSPAVANALTDNNITTWRTAIDRIPRSERWFLGGYIRRGTFTECLSVACNQLDGADSDGFPLISLLTKITPPGKRLFDMTIIPRSGVMLQIFPILYMASTIMTVFVWPGREFGQASSTEGLCG
jgi:hypothetical protein